MKVLIDRVEYVPFREVQPANSRAIMLALLSIFGIGGSHNTDEELFEIFRGLKIEISEDLDSRGSTIEDLLFDISQYSQESK